MPVYVQIPIITSTEELQVAVERLAYRSQGVMKVGGTRS